ncbi:MAG TPA: UDP-galactopyranose mutase [Actinomycetota bacterium]
MKRFERLETDVVVVGAGFAGSILAERLAAGSGMRVLLMDRRDHIGGNAYDYIDDHGVLVHKYGPHIFHTNAEKVVDYLSRFTEWRPYEHRVRGWVDGKLVPIPINRTTVNELYGLNLQTDEEVAAFYAERAEPIDYVRTSEEAVVSKVGRDLYEKFFRGYTRKQWKRDPSELHGSVASRIPTRTNTDDRYFTDTFQNMPAEGFTAMFTRMTDHPLIDIRLSTDFFDVRDQITCKHVVFTGPVDLYFDRCYGELPYRSLEFELRTEPTPGGGLVQPVGTINEPDFEVPYTRTTEFRHLTGQQLEHSTMIVEYPRDEGDPYYPIPSDETKALYKRYEALAAAEEDVTFVGRLARYQYLNMDQVTGQALSTYAKLAERLDLPVAA